MSGGQTLLAIGSLVLLGKLALSTNAFIADAETSQFEDETVATATSIGQGMLEKICVRGFDQNWPGGVDTITTAHLVSPLSLGVDAGENAVRDTTFNDVDDFRNYKDSVNTPRFGKFYVSCRVYYVRETAPYDSIAAKSFLKRVDVSMTNNFMTNPNDPLKLPVPLVVSRYVAYD
jgi:hypothetical protein